MSKNLEDYNIIQSLTQNHYCELFRAINESNKDICLLKTSRPGSLASLAQQSLKREFSILKQMRHEGIIKPIELIEKIDGATLMLEDHQEVMLGSFLQDLPISVKGFYVIAEQLCDIIAYVHSKNIIHKDIKLENILINPKTLKIHLIDFSLASKISQSVTQLVHPNQLEGSLAYISPEQTGRMNRSYDYRTDFYSLGVFFYKMLTGKFPFNSTDVVGLVYAHLTEIPQPINELNPHVPEMLAKIIAKCLEKTPENRYQSAFGLKYDLLQSKALLQPQRLDRLFKLGQRDIPSHFQLSEKVYGREKDIEILLQEFEVAKTSPMSLLLLSGRSGVGKTLLVQELYKPLTEKDSIFISGKFDQYQMLTPYVAWIQALNKLVDYLLSLSSEDFNEIKLRINEAIFPNGQVMINFIPALEKVIGKQPAIVLGSPEQEQNRFYYIFYQFINAISIEGRPLVIYLDDWQWADQPSMRLLEVLVIQYKPSNVLCICSYRDNEVYLGHLFYDLFQRLKQKDIRISELKVHELIEADVSKMLSDSLFESDQEKIAPLAKTIFNKTRGNPFFMVQYLKTMYHNRALYFDNNVGKWAWDLNEIEKITVDQDVVALMIAHLKTLSNEVQHALQFASCIGNTFDLTLLSQITKIDEDKLIKILLIAIQHGFIMQMDPTDSTGEIITGSNRYRFTHDKLQQASYELFDKHHRIDLHYQIATILCKNISKSEFKKRIFYIVNHFIYAQKRLINKKEKWQFVKLTMIAGKMAMKAIAYKTALKYFDVALKHFKGGWDDHYDMMLNLHKQICECSYLNYDFELTSKIANMALKHIKHTHEKFYIYGVIVSSLNAQSKPLEAIDTTWNVLRTAGIKLPYHTTLPRVIFMIMRLYWHLFRCDYKTLVNRPQSKDLVHAAAIGLITRSLSPFYAARDPYVIVYTGCVCFTEVLTKGYTPTAPLLIISFSIMFCMFRDFKRAMMLANVSLSLIEEDKDKWQFVFSKTIYAAFIMPWNAAFEECIDGLMKTRQFALNIGHLEAAALSSYWEINCLRYKGIHIQQLKENLLEYFQKNLKMGQFFISNAFLIQLQALENLENNTDKPWYFKGNYIDEYKSYKSFKKENDVAMIKHLFYNKFLVATLFGHYKAAYHSILKGNLIREEREPGSFENVYANTLIIFVLSQFYPRVHFKNRLRIMRIVLFLMIALKSQAKQMPANYLHWYQFANGCYYHMKNKYKKAEYYFLSAKSLAKSNNFKFEYARFCDVLGNFYLARNNEHEAFLNLAESSKMFLDLGVMTKAKHIIDRHLFLINRISRTLLPNDYIVSHLSELFPSQKSLKMNSLNKLALSSNLNMETLSKVSQALSTEIILPKLIERVMYSIIENIGAERSVLLLNKDNRLYVDGSIQKGYAPQNVLSSIALDACDSLPKSVIEYVFRSQEYVLLSNASPDARFYEDDYLQKSHPASILCTPIVYQQKIIGIFYFENKTTAQIFKSDTVEMIKLLSPQIAISIQNAILYSSFKRFVPTNFLKLLGKESLLNIQKGDCVSLQLTVLFLDLRNFTQLAEKLTPREVFSLLNDFFTFISPAITHNGGFIDKYIGDAVMAIFPHWPDNAIEAGIAIRKAIAEFNTKRPTQAPIQAGVGIHTGSTILGTIGDQDRLDGSVVSDVVNTASRVESQNKIYHAALLITEETYRQIQHKSKFYVRLIDKVLVRGKEKIITLYQVLNAEPDDLRNQIMQIQPHFEMGWYFYQAADFLSAITHFEKCVNLAPLDQTSKILLKRCQHFLTNPPDKPWQGACISSLIDI